MLEVRTIRAEYLIAMKLVSGRRYKKDLSDIIGILYEQQKQSKPVTLEMIDRAVLELYNSWDSVDTYAKAVLEKALASDDLASLFEAQMAEEAQAKDAVLEIDKKYPDLITADNINDIIEQARKKKNKD